jgi:cytochrome c-type biogenesis protein CcmF
VDDHPAVGATGDRAEPVAPQQEGEVAVIGVNVQPLVVWLWIGGGLIALGTIMAAVPGRRRRNPIRPVSEPIGTTEAHAARAADEVTPAPVPAGSAAP